jgi:DNA-binding CsgD family transcriptional regulator
MESKIFVKILAMLSFQVEAKPMNNKIINSRALSVLTFSLLSAYLLSFVFEGQVLYRLTDYFEVSSASFVFAAIFAHFVGLSTCGFFIKTLETAKKTLLYVIGICIICTIPFFFHASILWTVALIIIALICGWAVAAWGFFLKSYTPKNERVKTCADVLIFSNILMIAINFTAIYFSPFIGLSLSMLALLLAGYFTILLPINGGQVTVAAARKPALSLKVPMLYLALFVVILTINSGLMYQVFNPAFGHLTWLTSWYWAVPYILALFIMRNLPVKTRRSSFLYIALAMMVASFITFMLIDRSAAGYLVVDTLMLGACGIFDLFWWSILGEMLEFTSHPARVFGTGLSANVLGVLLGGLIGFNLYSLELPNVNTTVIALVVVCVTLIILPTLNSRLVLVLKNHTYLTAYFAMEENQQKQIRNNVPLLAPLTRREHEVLGLMMEGKTNKHIAAALYISENTVKTHTRNIMFKYEVSSRTQLIVTLLQNQVQP